MLTFTTTRDFCRIVRQAPGGISVIAFLLAAIFVAPDASARQDLSADSAKQWRAVDRAIDPIEWSMEGYRENRHCFSCHHHAHALIALNELARRGFEVDQRKLRIQFQRSVVQTELDARRYIDGESIGGGVDTAGHALLALQTGGHSPDAMTDAVIQWLIARAEVDGSWPGIDYRPPTQASDWTRAWLCTQGLLKFKSSATADAVDNQLSKVKKWASDTKAVVTEEQVARLRTVYMLAPDDASIDAWVAELVAEQRSDGGWGQSADLASDAYATGSVLMTLHAMGAVDEYAESIDRGIEYLLATQLEDGTWHVRTRSRPVQEFFETGFPHGADQYISFTATCWAATAIAMSFPVVSDDDPFANSDWTRISVDDRDRLQELFDAEVWPIITDNGDSSCINCHHPGHKSSLHFSGDPRLDLSMLVDAGFLYSDDRESLLHVVQSQTEHVMMPPPHLDRLSPEQIDSLQRFVHELNQALHFIVKSTLPSGESDRPPQAERSGEGCSRPLAFDVLNRVKILRNEAPIEKETR